MKLDLGCGSRSREGFLGVDISADCGADIVHDLSQMPWPFEDASVEEVYCSHFLEHLDGEQRMSFMNELYRILKPAAKATIITPYWTWVGAIQDPTHRWPPIAEQSYYYFNREMRERMGVSHYPIHCNFELRLQCTAMSHLNGRSREEIDHAHHHQLNAVTELVAELIRR